MVYTNLKHKIENDMVVSLIFPINRTKTSHPWKHFAGYNRQQENRSRRMMIWGSFSDCGGKHGWGSSKDSRPTPLPRVGLLLGSRCRVRGYICQDPRILVGTCALSLPMEYGRKKWESPLS